MIICPVPGCSGMFQDVRECSMFWVLLTPPNFFWSVNNAAVHINAVNVKCLTTYKKKGGTKGIKINGVRHHNLEGDMILYLAVHLIKFQNCSAFFFFGLLKIFFSRDSKNIRDCSHSNMAKTPFYYFFFCGREFERFR